MSQRLIIRTYRQELLVQRSDSVKLSEPHLELNVTREQFRLGAHANASTENFASSIDIETSNLEISVCEPQLRVSHHHLLAFPLSYLGERERPVRDKLDSCLVNVSGPIVISRVNLLESSVLEPYYGSIRFEIIEQIDIRYC